MGLRHVVCGPPLEPHSSFTLLIAFDTGFHILLDLMITFSKSSGHYSEIRHKWEFLLMGKTCTQSHSLVVDRLCLPSGTSVPLISILFSFLLISIKCPKYNSVQQSPRSQLVVPLP